MPQLLKSWSSPCTGLTSFRYDCSCHTYQRSVCWRLTKPEPCGLVWWMTYWLLGKSGATGSQTSHLECLDSSERTSTSRIPTFSPSQCLCISLWTKPVLRRGLRISLLALHCSGIWRLKFGLLVEKTSSLIHTLRLKLLQENIEALQKHSAWFLTKVDFSACWNKYVLFVENKSHDWLLPLSYALLLHNKVCDFLSSIILIRSDAGVCYKSNPYDIALWQTGTPSHLACHRANYFEVAKAIEGLVVAETPLLEENWAYTTLCTSIAKELTAMGFSYSGSDIDLILRTPLRHELAGLIKIPGHPLIDIAATAKKAEMRPTTASDMNYCTTVPIKWPPLPSGLLRWELIPALGLEVRNSEMRVSIDATSDDWSYRVVRCLATSCLASYSPAHQRRWWRKSSNVWRHPFRSRTRAQPHTPRILRRMFKGEFQTWQIPLSDHWEKGSQRPFSGSQCKLGLWDLSISCQPHKLWILCRVLKGEIELQTWRKLRFSNRANTGGQPCVPQKWPIDCAAFGTGRLSGWQCRLCHTS